MKRILNKTTMAILLALAMALALFGGLFFAKRKDVATAATSTTVTVTTDKTSYFPGDTFKLTLNITTTNPGVYLSLSLDIGILNDSGVADAETQKLFTFSNFSTTAVTNKNKGQDGRPTKADFTESSSLQANGMYRFSLSKAAGATGLSSSTPIELTMDVTVKADTPIDTDYTIGIPAARAYFVRTVDSGAQKNDAMNDATVSTINSATFNIRKASTNNNLETLKVGQGEDESKYKDITVSDSGMTITVTDPSSPLTILTTTEEPVSGIVLKPGDIELTDGKGSITIPADGVVTIEVTAESGDKKTYTLNVNVVGANLTALTVTTDTQKTDLTKNGLKEAFAAATKEYTVYVPSDSTKVTFNATVSTGNSAKNELALAKTGACTIPTSATSGTAFDVTDIANNDTLTITAQANDGTTESLNDYKITFVVVDVDTSIKTLTVVGATTGKAFTNESDLATDNTVDYYFFILSEPNGEANVTIEANSTKVSAVSLDGAAYTTTKKLAEGNHTIRVEAEAGNVATYSFILKNKVSLKLKADATVDFIRCKTEIEDNVVYNTMESYKKAKIVHGVDDLKYERYVIGKIAGSTSINSFLANFADDQLSMIRLYDGSSGEMMYNLGQPADGYTDEDLSDPDYYSIGTGWYIEFVVDGTVEETIYCSVLGDIDGNGEAGAPYDMSLLISYVEGIDTTLLNNLEVFLAAMVTNYGTISSGDIGELCLYYQGQTDITQIFASI